MKSATCTEDGFTGDLVCKSCGTVVTPGEVIPAAGHTDADGDGKCDVCGAEVGTQPTDPTQPTEPTTPEQPEQPVQPENPADDSSVKTGDNTHLTLWAQRAWPDGPRRLCPAAQEEDQLTPHTLYIVQALPLRPEGLARSPPKGRWPFGGGEYFAALRAKCIFATYTPPQNTDWVLFAACGPRTL